MQTKDFKAKLAKRFCHLTNTGEWLNVMDVNDELLYKISKSKPAILYASLVNENMFTQNRLRLQKLVYQYSRTPIDQREPEQRYCVHIVKGSTTGYLNYILSANVYFVDTNADSDDIRVIFTQREIDKLKQRDDLAIDWEKALEPVEIDK